MSAIFGVMNLDGRPIDPSEMESMNAALALHGPDANGIRIDGNAGLGQRLMRFTPEDCFEQQPAVGGEGNYTLVAEGRVDNRPELMEELRISAADAREMPDSTFILRAYEKWGEECCSRLVGDFAFAIRDHYEDHILLARSAMSKRPIFYHQSPGRFAFASSPNGLFALRWIPREIDHQSLADYLVCAPRDPGRSLFADLSELREGHLAKVGRKRLSIRPWWRPELLGEIRFGRDSDYVEAFTALFDRVISDHVRSLTPVGVMMSGGLDSSSVAVSAARSPSVKGPRVAAFTEVPRPGFNKALSKFRYGDETAHVKAIANRYENLDLCLVQARGLLLDGIHEFFESVQGPFRAAWNRIWWEAILRESASQDVRVLLTGLPGNLTISQEGQGLLPQLIAHGRWLRAYREARAYAEYKCEGSPSGIFIRGAAALLPTNLWTFARRLHGPADPIFRYRRAWRAYSSIRPEFACFHRVEERARRNQHNFRPGPGSLNRAARYTDLRRWGAAHLLTPGYEVLTGVQTRDPAGDPRLVEFCLSLPEDQHRHRGVPRSLIRRAMAGRLPPEVLSNQMRGLQTADWIERAASGRGQMLSVLDQMENNELARSALDLPGVRRMLDGLPGPGCSADRLALHYRSALGSAFMTGSFLLWFESGRSRSLARAS